MNPRERSLAAFALAGLIVVGVFGALLLGKITWQQGMTALAMALGAVGLYHAPAPGDIPILIPSASVQEAAPAAELGAADTLRHIQPGVPREVVSREETKPYVQLQPQP